MHVHPKTQGAHELGGEGSHPINALPVDIFGPHFHAPSLYPCSSGTLVVQQPLPLGNQGEFCVRELYFITPHRFTYVMCTYILHFTHDTIIHCGRFYL